MIALLFLRPGMLWLLLVLPLFFLLPRIVRTRSDATHAVLRGILFALAILALAAPVQERPSRDRHLVVVLDGSSSPEPGTRAATLAALREACARQDPATRLHFVGLGIDASAFGEDSPSFATTSRFPAGASQIGDALLHAGQRIPVGTPGAVLLLSDGLATDRHWQRATETLTARKIPLHTTSLSAVAGDVRPVRLTLPPMLRVGRSAQVIVDVVGTTGAAVVEIADSTGTVAKASGPVRGRRAFRLEFEPKRAGFEEITVRVDGGAADRNPDNNRLQTVAAIQDPIRTLHLGDRIQGSAEQLQALLGAGFEIDSVPSSPGSGAQPEGGPALDGYDLVVIDDRSAKNVPKPLQKALVQQITDRGLGFCMTGGSGSFGPGGYHDTPLASVLPVDLVQKEEKKDPSTSLAIIIDTSGSMGGARIVLAKEVCRLALRRLLPHDKVGIVEFFGNKRWAAPLQSAANAIDIQRAMNRLDAGGGTILYPAIEEAYFGLRNVQTRYKHVLVLTDAGVESGPYEQLLRRMARDGICVSTVLVGSGRHSEFLVELADWGRGRFYNASDRFNLPEVMLKQPSSARLPGYRTGDQKVEARGGSRWWRDIQAANVPPVQGYVETRARAGAEVVLRTARDKHPLLASWRFGLGRVTTFATEPTGNGTAAWKDWPDYGKFLARVLTRTAANGSLPFHFELRRERHSVAVTATRLDPGTTLPTAAVLGEEGEPETPCTFREQAPGIFLATLTCANDAPLRMLAGAKTADGAPFGSRLRLADPAASDRAAETQVDPELRFDLAAAAAATGGTAVPLPSLAATTLTTGGGNQPVGLRRLWPWCLLLALVFYLFDVLWRRRPSRP